MNKLLSLAPLLDHAFFDENAVRQATGLGTASGVPSPRHPPPPPTNGDASSIMPPPGQPQGTKRSRGAAGADAATSPTKRSRTKATPVSVAPVASASSPPSSPVDMGDELLMEDADGFTPQQRQFALANDDVSLDGGEAIPGDSLSWLFKWPKGHKQNLWAPFVDSDDDDDEGEEENVHNPAMLAVLQRYMERTHKIEKSDLERERKLAVKKAAQRQTDYQGTFSRLRKDNDLLDSVTDYVLSYDDIKPLVQPAIHQPQQPRQPSIYDILNDPTYKPPQDTEENRQRIWKMIARVEIPKVHAQFSVSNHNKVQNAQKLAQLCQREVRRVATIQQKKIRDNQLKAKRLGREGQTFWKKNEREEREARKRAEKEEFDRQKKEDELREARLQQRKLNFLITQTELYSHFLAKKVAPGEASSSGPVTISAIDFDNDDDAKLQRMAELNAQSALEAQKRKTQLFDEQHRGEAASSASSASSSAAAAAAAAAAASLSQEQFDSADMDLTAPSTMPNAELLLTQPAMLRCQLKSYQLKGLSWIANLYEQGINGILADEMGLGKTVQSISVIAHLAERHNVWGPFLIVSPASTLHNWQQEFEKFTPDFKVIPYWGSSSERKTLRKFWSGRKLHGKDSPFHVLITSYQLIVQDEEYFKRTRWQYMILDEAQALKSSGTIRWNTLLKLNCRNRLLLTGTPIQNTMQELWALLHFIMPTLFDSHEEFSEWFAKDIESHATGESEKGLDRHQLNRLHMILKPFMLRRVKKDVENELGDKIEIDVPCYLSSRQRRLHQGVKNKISIAELLQKSTLAADDDKATMTHLMGLVTQFRKVCNHPELFERRAIKSPIQFSSLEWMQDTVASQITSAGTRVSSSDPRSEAVPVVYNNHNPIAFQLPKLLYRDDIWDSSESGATTGSRSHVLHNLCNVWSPAHIAAAQNDVNDPFGFASLAHLSPGELTQIAALDDNLLLRWLLHAAWKHSHYDESSVDRKANAFSVLLQTDLAQHTAAPKPRSQRSPLEDLCQISEHWLTTPEDWSLTPREVRLFYPKLVAEPIGLECSDRSAYVKQHDITQVSAVSKLLLTGVSRVPKRMEARALPLFAPPPQTIVPLAPMGSSFIALPDPDLLILDAGKLKELDRLLPKLKAEGHRVLIYCQMTKMIDIMEDYMHYRGYQYLRLDGSSKISDRRDMVQDFQTRDDIFIFILSTRAGGLGINLTSADTVIFYECDWNPTMDQQAMDRAHRLGQTKQVTVYRMITKGTIEERILLRAKQKHEIQKVVMTGGEFKMDEFKNTREVLSLLLGEEEMEEKVRAQQEQRHSEETKKDRKRDRSKRPATPAANGNGSPASSSSAVVPMDI